LVQHIEKLLEEAEQQRGRQEFEAAGQILEVAQRFTDVSWGLHQTERELQRLVEIQPLSPLAAQIKGVLDQWPALVKQAHQLARPRTQNLAAALSAVAETAARIQGQSQRMVAEHQAAMDKVEGRADAALDQLAAAWEALQTVLPLAQPDPLADSYHALWPKREAAHGNPAALEAFILEAGQLTRHVTATRATLQDRQREMSGMLARLPAILAQAQVAAEDWLCLQRLAEQVAARRAVLENLYHEAFTPANRGTTREVAERQIADFSQQSAELNKVYDELLYEAREIGRFDKIIRDHWQAIQDNPAGLDDAKVDRAVKMTDTQYERAMSAENCKDTRAALEKCLNYVEKLALN
jgi:hypothetical protein